MSLDFRARPENPATPWAGGRARDVDGLTTSLVLTEGALERLLPEWWGLWHRSDASPFGSPAWLFSWWRTYGPGDLFVIAVRRHGTLVGLAPLFREIGRGRNTLHLMGAGAGGETDLVLDRGDAPAATAAMAACLVEYADLWDAVSFDGVQDGGHAVRLDLGGDFTTRLGRATPSRPGADEPDPAFDRVDATDATVVGLLERFIALDGSDDARLPAFLRRATPALRVAGLLDLAGFERDGQVVAVRFALAQGNRTRLWRVASQDGPGAAPAGPAALRMEIAPRA